MKLKAHMICHTHWDREWYLTKEQFFTKLVRLIDGLLDLIDTEPEYISFMLDGQTIAIEDYLAIKPYQRERLYSALSSGKIVCGPWYILPDELLISGESHIRNYLMGAKILGSTAAQMKTAYLPDSFGHPSQMPQIIAGLGMDSTVFWRGVPSSIQSTEFYWQAPNGNAKILCVHLPHGYGNCGNLSSDISKTAQRVQNLLNSLCEKCTTDTVLLMNGSDHITGQNNIIDIVKKLNVQIKDSNIKLSKFEDFFVELRRNLPALKTYQGEFRSGERSLLLGGTLSTRMELKQANALVQTQMERYLEPLLAAEYALGSKWDAKGYSDYIWKKILENHPHDSICGCSIDEVHCEMQTRFDSLSLLQKTLFNDAIKRLEEKITSKTKSDALSILVFEPTYDSLPSYVSAVLDFDRILVQEVNFTNSTIENYESQIKHPQMPQGFIIKDEAGREIPFTVISSGKDYDTVYQDETLPEIYKSNRVHVAMLLPGFNFGLHKLFVETSYNKAELISKNVGNNIENVYYKVEFVNGSLNVFDKVSGKEYNNVHKFIDKGDAGDEYTYSWPQSDCEYTLSEKGLVLKREILPNVGERLIIEGVLVLPIALEDDRKSRSKQLLDLPVTVEITLLRSINRIDFKTKLENTAMDHRLQVQFPSGTNADASLSFNTFGIEKRPVDLEIPKSWAEYPQSTHPTHGFVSLDENKAGICLGCVGLPEFEAVRSNGETKLNLTLLRCVGWLSRTDLITREGNGGWTIATPNAQCLKKYEFCYSISYFNQELSRAEEFAIMERMQLPCICTQLHSDVGSFLGVNVLSFLSQLPYTMRISAVKIAEDGQGIVVRFFSIASAVEGIQLNLPKEICGVQRVNLAEKHLQELIINSGKLTLAVEASQIITLKFLIRMVV